MSLRIVFAGDRDIAVKVLKFIIKRGVKPLTLMVPTKDRATYSQDIIRLYPHLEENRILRGNEFRTERGKNLLRRLDIDYMISIHFPYIYPKEVLEIPKHGVLNLHPAYLPYNRGWHTPTWAIWDETPYGTTLHFMDEGIDTGDIIHQKLLEIRPDATADSLYKQCKKLEFEVFKEAWPQIVEFKYSRVKQKINGGTTHKKSAIRSLQLIDLEQHLKVKDIIKKLRALTTNKVEEAAYFIVNGKKFRIQIRIIPE